MPLSLLFIPYGLFLIVFAVFSLVNIYHIVSFGTMNLATFLATFAYLAVAVLILFFTTALLAGVDWTVPLFQGFPTSAPTLGL